MPPRRRQPARRSNRRLWLALVLGGLLAAGLVVASVVLSGSDSGADATLTEPVSSLEGVPQNGIGLGAPDASVTLIEYADLACPFCAKYANEVLPAIVDRYVRTGKLRLEFRGLAFLAPVENSDRALRYALSAGAQNKLWDYLERVYANQGQEGTEWFTDEFGRSVGEQIPGLDADRLADDAGGSEVTAAIDRAAEQARADQITGTPSFLVKVGSQPAYTISVSELSPEAFVDVLDDALAE